MESICARLKLRNTFCWRSKPAGALERMHDRAVRLTGAVTSAVAIAIESTILLNIAVRITQVRPHVEKSVQR